MPISTAVFAFSVACLTSLILTPMVRRLAVRLRWRDCPGGAEHKARCSTRTHAGGIGVLLALLIAVWSVDASFPEIVRRLRPELLLILPGALLAAGVGLVDDLRGCRPFEKLAVQIAGAVVVVSAVAALPPSWLHAAWPVPVWLTATILGLWIVGTTNALNLVDGIDGLAPGIATLNAAGLTVLAIAGGELGIAVLAAATAGCALGFLRSNRHPAKIYLGDSGSMLLGFLLGAIGVVLVGRSATPTTALAVVLLGWVPLLDTGLAVVRRISSGMSPFRPDRDHIHHRLVSRGLSVRLAAGSLWSIQAVAVAAGIAIGFGAPVSPCLAAIGIVTLPLARVVLPLRVTVRVDDPRRDDVAPQRPDSEPALGAAQNRAA